MATLSELIKDKMYIEDMLVESGGEITPEIEEAMGFNESNIREKIDSYHALVVKMNCGTAEVDGEIKRLQDFKRAKQNAVRNLKERLLYLMKEAGLERIDGNLCKAYVRNNAPSVEFSEDFTRQYEEALQGVKDSFPGYITVTVGVDKSILKNELKDSDVEGARLVKSQSVMFR